MLTLTQYFSLSYTSSVLQHSQHASSWGFVGLRCDVRTPPHSGACRRLARNSASLRRWLNMQDGKINFKLNQSNLLNQLIMRFRVREQSCLRSVHLVKRLHCELYFIFIFEPRQPNSFPRNFSTHFTMERPIKDNCNKCGIRFSPSFHELI